MKSVALCLWLAPVVISGCDSGSPAYRDLSGNPLEVSGKVLVVNYWAEWCKPCRQEIPELNRFQQQYADRVQVVGVNFDGLPLTQVREQAQAFGIAFPVLAEEPAARWGQPRPEVLPATLFIGADGRWRKTLLGEQTVASLEQALEEVVRSAAL